MATALVIRDMVCDRCKAVVKRVLTEQGMAVKSVELGEVQLDEEPLPEQMAGLRAVLKHEGFELVDGREATLIARIKAAIVQLVHHSGTEGRVKLSEHLSDALNKEYSSLSQLFTQVEGITIEQYFLLQRIERVKELIKYDEISLSEIADRVGFSSVAHLSGQFKKLTGMTPTAYKARGLGRTPLDQVAS